MDMQSDPAAQQAPGGTRLEPQRWRNPALAFVGLGLLGTFLIYYATAWGPWAYSDATGYITAARNLIAGHGIGAFDPSGQFSPGVSHPPLYVLTLAAVSLPGLEPLVAARAVDVVLFGVLIAACGLLVFRQLSSLWAGLSFSALLLVHPALIIAYTSAMAEPPFILLGLLSLLFLNDYLTLPRRVTFLAAAVCAAGAFLSRYPGAAYVLTGAMAIALHSTAGSKARLQRAAGFAAIGVLPVGAFLLWSATLPASESPRALGGGVQVLPALLRFVRGLGEIAWSWKPIPPAELLPDSLAGLGPPDLVSGVLSAAALLVLLLLIGSSLGGPLNRRLRAQTPLPISMLIRVFALFAATYLAFFVAAYLVTDPTPDVDSRTLLPLLPALLGIGVGFVEATSRAQKERSLLRWGWIGVLMAALAGYAVISQDIVTGLHRTGLGYTGRDWRASPTIAAIVETPPDQALISNEPSAILLLTGRTPYSIPEIAQLEPVVEFTPFGSGSTAAEQAFHRGQARLVVFESIHDQFKTLYGERADERLEAFVSGLQIYTQTADGAIYGVPVEGGDP